DPENAWVAGLLAPLGWLAVCVIDPGRAAVCLTDPALPRHPARTQKRHWGADHSAIARRLARHWRLPGWLAGGVGHRGLAAEVAGALGADPDLLRIVQLAVALTQRSSPSYVRDPNQGLHLVIGGGALDIADGLGLPVSNLEALQRQADEERPVVP